MQLESKRVLKAYQTRSKPFSAALNSPVPKICKIKFEYVELLSVQEMHLLQYRSD